MQITSFEYFKKCLYAWFLLCMISLRVNINTEIFWGHCH